MKMVSTYPYLKIIVSFTFSPLVAGFLYGLVMVIFALFSEDSSVIEDVSTTFGIMFVGPFAFGVSAAMLFGVPAFFASLIYAVLRLYRTWHSYLLVTFVGGWAAHLWIPVIFSKKYIPWELTDIFHAYFVLGALSSLLIAYFVLPQKSIVPPECTVQVSK